MKKQNKWEKFYSETPLDEISWQHAQDDYLKEVIDSGKVKPGSVLDLGCGTGMKSVFLAKKGFQATGVDISRTAIDYANDNSKKAGVEVEFIVADATDLSFLGDKKFDFILDWANLHGIPKEKREKYISEIIKHTKKGSRLLLRCFGRKKDEEEIVEPLMGKIYLFLKEDIQKLYGQHFKILETNISKPGGDTAPGKFFYEFLMERI